MSQSRPTAGECSISSRAPVLLLSSRKVWSCKRKQQDGKCASLPLHTAQNFLILLSLSSSRATQCAVSTNALKSQTFYHGPMLWSCFLPPLTRSKRTLFLNRPGKQGELMCKRGTNLFKMTVQAALYRVYLLRRVYLFTEEEPQSAL